MTPEEPEPSHFMAFWRWLRRSIMSLLSPPRRRLLQIDFIRSPERLRGLHLYATVMEQGLNAASGLGPQYQEVVVRLALLLITGRHRALPKKPPGPNNKRD